MKKKTKKVSKNPVATQRGRWNVWIEADPSKKGYFEGRDAIEASCGDTSGSGCGFGEWDCSYHEIKTEQEALAIGKKACRFKFVKSVHVYEDEYTPKSIYLKGKA